MNKRLGGFKSEAQRFYGRRINVNTAAKNPVVVSVKPINII